MNTRNGFLAVVVCGLALVGCVAPAVYPYYLDADLILEPGIVGAWIPTGTNPNKEFWVFEKSGEKSYAATIVDGNETNQYSLHFFKLKEQEFADAVFLAPSGGGIPAHVLVKVAQVQPTLRLQPLNYKFMDDLLGKDAGALKHIVARDNPDDTNTAHLVLTATTEELQKFVVKYMGDTNMFGGLDEMKRADATGGK